MTTEIREEMRKYRKLAIIKEKQLKQIRTDLNVKVEVPQTKCCKKITNPIESTNISIDHELNQNMDANEVVETEEEEADSQYMQVSSMIPNTDQLLSQYSPSVSAQILTKTCNNKSPITKSTSMPADSDITKCLYGSVDSVCKTPEPKPGCLIRSNSYTLDTPSPLFLKHLENKGLHLEKNDQEQRSVTTVPQTPESSTTPLAITKTKPKVGLIKKQSPKCVSTTKSRKLSYEKIYGSKASPVNRKASSSSDISTITPKSKRPEKTNAVKLSKKSLQYTEQLKNIYTPKAQSTRPSLSVPPIPPSGETKMIDLIMQIENDRKSQMALLIERQKVEQKQMQEEFRRQQEHLLKQVTTNCSNLLSMYQSGLTKDCNLGALTNGDISFRTSTPNITTNEIVDLTSEQLGQMNIERYFDHNQNKSLNTDANLYNANDFTEDSSFQFSDIDAANGNDEMQKNAVDNDNENSKVAKVLLILIKKLNEWFLIFFLYSGGNNN